MIYVYPRLGKSGLGNLLIDWAHAEVFAALHQLPILAPNWTRVTRIGVWMRRERYKRFYGWCFRNSDFVRGLRRQLVLWMYPRLSVETAIAGNVTRGVVEFTGMVRHFFDGLVGHRAYICKRLLEIVDPKIVQSSRIAEPFIGVHLRRGDFCCSKLKTSDAWFVAAIQRACAQPEAAGINVICVFSDEYPERLKFLTRAFGEKRVLIMPKSPAIQDILSLSQAKVLVCSPHSTFSMWGVFLGQMPSVWKTDVPPPPLYEGVSKVVLVD